MRLAARRLKRRRERSPSEPAAARDAASGSAPLFAPAGGAGAASAESASPPILLISTRHSSQTVACCCELASRQGVRAGMTLAHARAVLQETQACLEEFDAEADALALERLARWAVRLAPAVAPDAPDGLLLDVSGCARLYGGLVPHVQAAAVALERIRLPARLAAAPTIGCAWALARYGAERLAVVDSRASIREAIAPLPVQALRLEASMIAALADVGVRFVGELLRLPRGELATRFGAALLRRIDQAMGDADETIRPVMPDRPLEASQPFEGPVKRIEVIVMAVSQLLSSLLAEAERRDCGVRGLEVELRRVDVAPVRTSITLTYPTRDEKHLWKLLEPRVERLHLGYGVEDVRLRATAAERVRPAQAGLGADWMLAPSGESLYEDGGAEMLGALLDQMIDQLGREAVSRVEAVESHLPEKAFVHRPVDDVRKARTGRRRRTMRVARERRAAEHAGASDRSSGRRGAIRENMAGMVELNASAGLSIGPVDRPSSLYERPEAAEVIALQPEGPPLWLQWRGRSGAVAVCRGPERIAAPWWQGASGARDYYEVRDENGRWLWVYRAHETGGWFVHGEWV